MAIPRSLNTVNLPNPLEKAQINVEQFRREREATRALRVGNIVRAVEVDIRNGTIHVVLLGMMQT
jgi:hypothetical protein